MFRRVLAIALACLVFSEKISGTNVFFVSPAGNDSNAGSIQSPFLTLQKAFDVLSPGDTVFLREGVYKAVGHQYANNFIKDKSGTSESPIVVMAYNGETPVIDGSDFPYSATTDPSMAVILMWNVSHVVVDGLVVRNGPRTGIHFVGQCEDVIVRNCLVEDCLGPGIGVGGYDAPYTLCKNVVVTQNTVVNCAQLFREAVSLRWVEGFEVSHNRVMNVVKECIDAKSGCSDGRIFNNTIVEGGDVSIYIDAGFSNTSVLKNIHVYDNSIVNPHGVGIAIASEEGNEGYGIHVYNNLIYDYNGGQGAGIKIAKNSASGNDGYIHDVFVCNNTVYGRGQQGLYVNLGGVANIVFRNNISVNNASQMALNTANGVNTAEIVIENNLFCGAVSHIGLNAVVVEDVGVVFENAGAGDFHLRENSPAIDAGTSATAPDTDAEGRMRPFGDGYDIGCYEFVTASPLRSGLRARTLKNVRMKF